MHKRYCEVGLLVKGEEVPVNVFLEDNSYDSMPLFSLCASEMANNVKEAVYAVHSALANRKITKITFAWEKYLAKLFCWCEHSTLWTVVQRNLPMCQYYT